MNVARESMPDPTWLADAGASISGSVQCWFHHVLRSVLSPSILAKTLPVLRKNADESARNLRSGRCQRLLNRELRHLLTRSESGAIRVMPPARSDENDESDEYESYGNHEPHDGLHALNLDLDVDGCSIVARCHTFRLTRALGISRSARNYECDSRGIVSPASTRTDKWFPGGGSGHVAKSV